MENVSEPYTNNNPQLFQTIAMDKKRGLLFLLAVTMCMLSSAQEMTVEQAMARMKQTTHDYLTDVFTEKDETGVDQFVDVEVKSIYDFSDFSYGALLDAFKEYLDSKVPKVTNSRGQTVKSPRAGDIERRNARMLEYAKQNMTKIAAYAAIADYDGVTKFHEKKSLSRLVFFDWKGDVIAFRNPVFSRNDFKSGLAPYMSKKVSRELMEMNDPLFLRREFWVSDVLNAEMSGRAYEMQWCYVLTKENLEDKTIDKGKFRVFYYQVQAGILQVIKSITVIDGRYEKAADHIYFSYGDASVESFHVASDDIATFTPGDYADIELDKLNVQLIETMRLKKMVKAMENTPASYEAIDDLAFRMTAPFSGDEVVTFHKNEDLF